MSMASQCKTAAGEPIAGSRDSLEQTDLQEFVGHDAPPVPFVPSAPYESEPMNVIDSDDRKVITDTRPIPWRMVCHLVVENDQGAFFTGTGWLGGPSTVYTASHVLLNGPRSHRARRVWVIPGRIGNFGGTIEAVGFATHPQWEGSQPAGADIAAIWLPTPIGRQLGTFGFRALADASLDQLPVESAGYPDERKQGYPIGTPMCCNDRIRAVLPQLLATQLDTEVGQSGSPVFFRDAQGLPIVLGIHAYGSRKVNHAVRLTKSVVDQFIVWWR